ncbi:MAG: hypothetical protein E6G08_03190 [Actinobacteria bacterium]|nr:MAG: hypothetical protein E6G08_03190 [Actinomycetota bacterium]
MHLDDSTLDGYLARSLDRDALGSFDDHVSTCLHCTLAVDAAGLEPDRWERRGPLGRLVRVGPPRPARAELDRAA